MADLHGLVLAGGHSRRMGQDKAALRLGGVTLLERAVALLAGTCRATAVAIQPDQRDDPLRRRFECIEDGLADGGPMAALMAAQQRDSTVAWLLLAVDMPMVDAAILDRLLAGRDAGAAATAYAGSGGPEPLCAVYEPASAPLILASWQAGHRSLQRWLMTSPAVILPAPCPPLSSINDPAQWTRYSDMDHRTDTP